ncbi:MAG: mechanosensitive ion channel [Cyanobacteriota bacterium]|nr:mechanosensitive ion channel [Cyanobacteriota bacterium]
MMAKLQKYKFKNAIAIGICLLSVFIWLSPVRAQDVRFTRAPVVLDGREILEVGPLGSASAEERAAFITSTLHSVLADSIQSEKQPVVEVVKQDRDLIVQVDSSPLLKVTENDLSGAMYPEIQAEIWQEQLQQNLNKSWQERRPTYTRRALQKVAIALGISILLQGGVVLVFRYVIRQKLNNPGRRWHSLQLLSLVLLQVGIWSAFITYGIKLFPTTRTWFYQTLQLIDTTFNARMFELGEQTVSLTRLLLLGVTMVVLWIAVGWFVSLLKSRLFPLIEAERSHQDTIAFFVRYGLLFIGSILILNAGGVGFQSLVILLGTLGVGIGFGLQNIVKDFISGLILIVTRPIKVGELVQVGDFQGLVQRINARTTEISHIDRYIITVPNSRFIEGEVLNWNRSGLTRVKAYVKVPHGSDIDFISTVLLAAARVEHPDILRHPPAKVKFREYTEDGLQFRLAAFIRDPLKEPKVRNHLYAQTEKYLRKYGIEVPRAQQDLHLRAIEPEISAWIRSQTPAEYKLKKPEVLPQELPIVEEEYDWEAIAIAMQGENGVSIRDRRFQFKVFQNVFLGSEAVEWLMVNERATREEAILMGRLMLERGMIRHVLDEHDLKDEPLFYQFCSPENNTESYREEKERWERESDLRNED